MSSFGSLVTKLIGTTPIRQRLQSKVSVVLERVARGGGATNWYFCPNDESLETIVERLLPGSVVSFYFDDRIGQVESVPNGNQVIGQIIYDTRDCVVAWLSDDGITFEVEIVTSVREYWQLVASFETSTHLFFGAFPGRDNDGENAITVTLPDLDGVVRDHPH